MKKGEKSFGAVLARARSKVRLSKTALGRSCGVGAPTISRWERGRALPAAARTSKLVEALARFDVAAARDVASAAGHSLASLRVGIGGSGSSPLQAVARGVVFAAAEAGDLAPSAVKIALLAALEEMDAQGLTPAMMTSFLREAVAKP